MSANGKRQMSTSEKVIEEHTAKHQKVEQMIAEDLAAIYRGIAIEAAQKGRRLCIEAREDAKAERLHQSNLREIEREEKRWHTEQTRFEKEEEAMEAAYLAKTETEEEEDSTEYEDESSDEESDKAWDLYYENWNKNCSWGRKPCKEDVTDSKDPDSKDLTESKDPPDSKDPPVNLAAPQSMQRQFTMHAIHRGGAIISDTDSE
jgi:Rad3-related DNA helicase